MTLSFGERYPAPCALLLGGFDGLHVGHATLLRHAKLSGFPVGLTSIAGGKKGGDLFTFPEREYIYAHEGIKFAIEIPFTERIKNMSANQFLQTLFGNVCVKRVYCGEDFKFGAGAEGDAELLKKLSPCPVEVLPIYETGGEKVAVSTVKKMLAEGDVRHANELLCNPYFIHGTVEHGRGAGRTFGFPTLNLELPRKKFPVLDGVYGGYAETVRGRYRAVVNIGARPTFGIEQKIVEAHLLGFDGDLYDTEAMIFLTEYLRPIRTFAGEEELKAQLKKDIARLSDVL